MTIEKEIESLETTGVFSLTAEKKYQPLKDFKDMELKKVYSVVVNLTKQSYEDFILNGERESQGTYCHSISNNKLLWQHNKTPQKYLRFYKKENTNFFPVKAEYYLNGKKISDKDRLNQIKASYFRKESNSESNVFNIKIENIISLKHGDIRIKKK
jgi:hypothetical protein